MRKKVAMILTLMMISISINTLADTDNGNGVILTDDSAANESSRELMETLPKESAGGAEKMPEETLQPAGGSTEESSQEVLTESSETLEDMETEENRVGDFSTATPALEEEGLQTENELEKERLDSQDALWNDDRVYNVLFPASSKVYLNPGGFSGKGQIFSEQYEVENHGNTDVAIKIKEIAINYASEESLYEFTEEEITDEDSTKKILNVDMVWENEDGTEKKIINISSGSEDEYVLWLKAAECDQESRFVSLNIGSTGRFYFTGTMNDNPRIDWEDDEVTITFHYEMINPDKINVINSEEKDTDTNREENPIPADEFGITDGNTGVRDDAKAEENRNANLTEERERELESVVTEENGKESESASGEENGKESESAVAEESGEESEAESGKENWKESEAGLTEESGKESEAKITEESGAEPEAEVIEETGKAS